MFTGLVEGVGIIRRVVPEGPGTRLEVIPPRELAGGLPGDSISINGCCLTVVEIDDEGWAFQAGPETLACTNIGHLQPGSRVNLERSLAANARLGGHFVQGHVDGTGTLDRIIPDGDWVRMWFRVPERLAAEMASKGSVAVDGISLTVVDANSDSFSVALIPHTLAVTTLGDRKPGDPVNIETDILAKYVRKLLVRES
jgi:riboflavin synthase